MVERAHEALGKAVNLPRPVADRVAPVEEARADLLREGGEHVRVHAHQVHRMARRLLAGGDRVLAGARGQQVYRGRGDVLALQRAEQLASVLADAEDGL